MEKSSKRLRDGVDLNPGSPSVGSNLYVTGTQPPPTIITFVHMNMVCASNKFLRVLHFFPFRDIDKLLDTFSEPLARSWLGPLIFSPHLHFPAKNMPKYPLVQLGRFISVGASCSQTFCNEKKKNIWWVGAQGLDLLRFFNVNSTLFFQALWLVEIF